VCNQNTKDEHLTGRKGLMEGFLEAVTLESRQKSNDNS
jgi:hypothetical protein